MAETSTIDPKAVPKQSDFSKVSNAAVTSWMDGLKETGSATATTEKTQETAQTTEATKVETKPVETEKKTEIKTEQATVIETEEGEDKWPRTRADWDRFKAVRQQNYQKRDTRIKELEAKLTEAEKSLKSLPTDPSQFETLKQERERYEKEAKDLSERLRLAAIESHPKFKAYFDGKVNAQIELAKRVVGPDKAEAIASTLRMPDGPWKTAQLDELSSNLSPVQASRLGSVLNSIEALEVERKSEIDRAKIDYESAQTKSAAEQTAAQERAKTEANSKFEAIVKQASDPKDGIALFQLKDGDDAWNKAVKARIDGARATLFGGNGQSPENLIRKALLAEAFPSLLENYNSLLAEIGTLKSQVDKLTKATPTLETRTATNGAGGGGQTREPSKPGSRPMEVAADWIGLLKSTT